MDGRQSPTDPGTSDTRPKLMALDAVAEVLGVHVETVRRMVRRGDLPAVKVGHVWRVWPEALDRYLVAGRRGG